MSLVRRFWRGAAAIVSGGFATGFARWTTTEHQDMVSTQRSSKLAGSLALVEGRCNDDRRLTMLMLILVIVLLVAVLGSLPTWPHSRNWGYYPSGGISLVVLILLILFLMGRL
jgi:hypothetical protein